MAIKQVRKTAPTRTTKGKGSVALPTLPEGIEAIPHAKGAAGLKLVRPGFAVTPAYDLGFALGFPYVLCPLPQGLSAAEQAGLAGSLSHGEPCIDPGVGRRVLRLILCQGFTWTPRGITLRPAGKKAIAKADRVTETEARSALLRLLSKSPSPSFLAILGFLLELELGSDTAAKLVCKGLLAVPDARLRKNDAERRALAVRLGFLLSRTSPRVARDVRQELDAWLRKKSRLLPGGKLDTLTSFEPQLSVLRGLDVMLNGEQGVARSAFRPGGKLDSSELFFCDEPKQVVAALKHSPNGNRVAPLDARHAFTGGPEALKVLMSRVTKLPRAEALRFVDTFGPIKSPLVGKWLKPLAKQSPKAATLLELQGSK